MRQSFLDFFIERGHSHQPSSPVIPLDDPTLLFVNAGMNQFKDVFTGSRKVSYKKATTSQKCIRAGGKHNDLENVGQTSRHHTFFEMLGNFSFGDYFKEEAIVFAWDWVTKVLGLPKDRLFATVFETDDDAFALWEKIAPELKNGRILRFGKEDNYWSMGNVGPCGPCSEIHYDMGEHLAKNDPHAWINTENDRYVEFWNLVFMQYDQPSDGGDIVPLPKPSVDTGAGLERIAAIMQGVDSNYETDLFTPLTAQVADITGIKYEPKKARCTSHRVIADHVRALSFALADGWGFSSDRRGSVLRSILRRAARHGRKLEYYDPIIFQLVPALVDIMGKYYPELKTGQHLIQTLIKREEESFSNLLDNALSVFSTETQRLKSAGEMLVSGEVIFRLNTTYGIPIDMIAVMARDENMQLDMEGFNKLFQAHKKESRLGSNFGQSGEQMKSFLNSFIASGILQPPTRINNAFTMDAPFDTAIASGSISRDFHDVSLVLNEIPSYDNLSTNATINITGDNFLMKVEGIKVHEGIYIHTGTLLRGNIDDNLIGKKVKISFEKDDSGGKDEINFTEIKTTEFIRGDDTTIFEVKAHIKDATFIDDRAEIILDKTPFYVESGGQIGDVGMIVSANGSIRVTHVVNRQDILFHVGKIQIGGKEDFSPGTKVKARIDKHRRKDIMRNHTATHLLHAALRSVLGDHVKQSGSLVEPERLRFDFAHFQAMTPGEVLHVEKLVNEHILEATPVSTEIKSSEEAMKSGAMALFGEKYGDEVRVVSVGSFSKELCGGTHVSNTAEIGLFMITEETAIASGVRRIEAVTGRRAVEITLQNKQAVNDSGMLLNVPSSELPDAIKKVSSNLSDAQKEIKKLKSERFSGGGGQSVGQSEKIGDTVFSHHDFGETDQDSMAGWSDSLKGSHDATVSLAVGLLNGKKTFIASASKKAIESGFDTGKHFGELIRELGGRGGGKPGFARGSLPDDLDFVKLIEKARKKLQEVVS
ncbi:MAG: alanine--tRNA ligase [Candidatus Zixiibacteriota bacterium]